MCVYFCEFIQDFTLALLFENYALCDLPSYKCDRLVSKNSQENPLK